MIKIITIGLIPKNCDYKTIYCGDSESSGTVELNFKIENQQIIGLDNNLHLPFVLENNALEPKGVKSNYFGEDLDVFN